MIIFNETSRIDTSEGCYERKVAQNEETLSAFADSNANTSMLLGGFAFATFTQFTKETMIEVELWVCYIIWIGLLVVTLLSIASANIFGLSHWLKSRGLPGQFYIDAGRWFIFIQWIVFALILPFIAYAVSGELALGIITLVIEMMLFGYYCRIRGRGYRWTLKRYKEINDLPNWVPYDHPDFDAETYDHNQAL